MELLILSLRSQNEKCPQPDQKKSVLVSLYLIQSK